MYIGTPQQEVQLILDTGSDWMVVEASDCTSCLNNTWDRFKSKTYSRVDNDYIEHVYGTALLQGYDAKDAVSMDLEGLTRVSKFEFFEIHQQVGIDFSVDGILGMSKRTNSPLYTSGPLWIDALFNNTLIDKRIFSFYLTNNDYNYVDIGYADPKAMKSSSPTVGGMLYIPTKVSDVMYWWHYTDAIRFGESGEVIDGMHTQYSFD